jgi:hypothetical protein
VDHGRHAAPCRRQHRRDRRIAAKADHRRRLEPADQSPRLEKATAEHGGGSCCGNRIARTQGRAGNDMDRVVRERLAVARGTAIRRQMHRDAAPCQRRG